LRREPRSTSKAAATWSNMLLSLAILLVPRSSPGGTCAAAWATVEAPGDWA